MKTLIAVLLLTASLFAQSQHQHQNQHQLQNVGNTTSNSHNNTNTDSSSASGGDASASGGQSSAVVGQTSSTSYNESIPRQTATAIAPPPFHTSPCIKGWGGAAQAPIAGLSLGGGKVDKGCDIRETAEQFRNAGSMVSFCKLMITEPSSIKAGITMDDCMSTTLPSITKPPTAEIESEPSAPEIVIAESVSLPMEVLAPPILAVKKQSVHKHVASKNCPTGEK